MKNKLRLMFLSVVTTVCFVSVAWGGIGVTNSGGANTAANLAIEALGTAINFTFPANAAPAYRQAFNPALVYVNGQKLTSGNLVQVTLSNATFTGGPVGVYGWDEGDAANIIPLATGNPLAGTTSYPFQLDFAAPNVAAYLDATNQFFNHIFIADNSGGNLTLHLPAGTTGSPTAAISLNTSGGTNIDPPAVSVVLGNLVRQVTPTITAKELVIDYINTPFDGTLFLQNSVGAGSSRRVASNVANNNISIRNIAPQLSLATRGITAAAVVNFDADTDWTGITHVWIAPDGGCAINGAGANSNIVANPTGAVALNIASASWNATFPAPADVPPAGVRTFAVCAQVDGTTELPARNLSGNVAINLGSPGVNQPVVTGNFHIWAPNGYQAYIPHMRYGDTTKTFVRLVNNSTRNAAMRGTIRLVDGTVIRDVNLGTIAAGETMTLFADKIAAANGVTVNNYALSISANVTDQAIFADAYFNLNAGGVWTTRTATVYNSQNDTYEMK